MGLFHRVSDILKANINRMLDQAEDPELVLDQLIQEMQESYRKSKIEVAKALADESVSSICWRPIKRWPANGAARQFWRSRRATTIWLARP
jgi:phage shock protein A